MTNRMLEYIDTYLGVHPQPAAPRSDNKATNSKPWHERIEEFVVENPGACLTGAFLIGVTIACLIKRR